MSICQLWFGASREALRIRWPSGRGSQLLASLPLVICFFSPQTFSFRKLPVVCTSKLPSGMGPGSPRVHALFSLSLGSNSALFDGCFPATDFYAFERENCPRIICLSQLLKNSSPWFPAAPVATRGVCTCIQQEVTGLFHQHCKVTRDFCC